MPSNCKVLDFSAFRKQRFGHAYDCALYIHDQAEWLESLIDFPSIRLLNAQCSESLATQLCEKHPDIILLESALDWADPIPLIQELDARYQVPIVMLCNSKPRPSKRVIKNAYAAGLSDLLYAGQADELVETLSVLLKYQRRLRTTV